MKFKKKEISDNLKYSKAWNDLQELKRKKKAFLFLYIFKNDGLYACICAYTI